MRRNASYMATTTDWHRLTAREQTVWAVAYAMHANAPVDAVSAANKAVSALRELNLDDSMPGEPEYEASRYGPGLSFWEFLAWYPVALKIARKGRIGPRDVDVAACQRAYDIYRHARRTFSDAT